MPGLVNLRFEKPVAVVGDIHGRADLLAELISQLGGRPLISVGDVVDRGPDVSGCVDMLITNGAIGVLGNHEEWVREWLFGAGFDSYALHPSMGGAATLASYGVEGRWPGEVEAQKFRVPAAHREWFTNLVDAIDLDVMGRKFWVVHSAPELSDLDSGEEEARMLFTLEAQRLRWGRYDIDRVPFCGRPVIAGHMTRPVPEQTTRCIAIDTGCGTVVGGSLTAVLLPERKFVTVR